MLLPWIVVGYDITAEVVEKILAGVRSFEVGPPSESYSTAMRLLPRSYAAPDRVCLCINSVLP